MSARRERPIYLDNNATTPVDPRVLDAMLPYFREEFGNAASRGHRFGYEAEKAVDRARRQVGDLIGASAREIVWTSGATEADNLAIQGALAHYADRGNHVVSCPTEHKAVLDTLRALEAAGRARVTWLDPGPAGRVEADQVREALTDETVLVALMAANNEIGTLHPLAEIGAACKERGVLFFSDAAQAAGKIPLDVEAMGIDLLALSAHKFYGPKGAGALYVRRRRPTVKLAPLLHGGGHERGMRSGTLNVPGIVGMGEAARIAKAELPAEAARLAAMRDRFEAAVLEGLDEVRVNGDRDHRLPGTTNLGFGYVEGESLMMAMKALAVSSGAACTSASLEFSHVLEALGLDHDAAGASLRFCFGRFNEEGDVDAAVRETLAAVERLRALSPRYRDRDAPGRARGP